MHAKMCASINFAVDKLLPNRRKGTGVEREVSDDTKRLFDKRTMLCNQGTAEQFDDVQKEIKKSSLKDFHTWVKKWSDKIGEAAGRGDTRAV